MAATRGRRSTSTPGRYTGPVPMVTHVHGAVGVGDESDGYAEAWYLPAAGNIPAGYATGAPGTTSSPDKAARRLRRRRGGPATPTFQYPNAEPRLDDLVPRPHPRHDPPQRLRRAGRLLPGPRRARRRQAVLDTRSGMPAVLPGPAPKEGDKFPANKTYYEIPIAIQDRSLQRRRLALLPGHPRVLRRDRRAVHPGRRDGTARFSPIWNPEFFGNTIMVERQHLALPRRRAAPLPVPLPQRLPVALPDPRLRRDPRRRGLADRQRGRLPRGARQHHRELATRCSSGPPSGPT